MRSRVLIGWLIGVITAGVAVGVGELVAAFVRPAAAPVIAVGNRLIVLTPQNVRESAIQSAGTNDKTLLLAGIYLLLAVFGGFVGELAMRRTVYGIAGVAAIGAFGTYCALTATASQGTDVVPTLVSTVIAAGVLVVLVHLGRQWAERSERADSDGRADSDLRADSDRAVAANGWPESDLVGTDRRRFLAGAGTAAVVAAAAGFGGRAAQDARFDVTGDRAKVALPAAKKSRIVVPRGADLGKSGVPWQTPNSDFYRIDTALQVPQLSSGDWQLRIHGLVDKPITLDYEQLIHRPLIERWITMCCVSNTVGGKLISNALFRGALLADLLREAGVHPQSDQLLMTSVDGMTIGAPTKVVMDGRDSLLAIEMNGEPLPIEHGYPVRVVVPGLYGYVSACKWVVDIEATMFQDREAFWVANGWTVEPPIQLESRIDRPTNNGSVKVGTTVPIAGIAWHQHVGISKVEVQVDDGQFQTARLAAVPSTDTWRQWVLPWHVTSAGTHRITVRATDDKGRTQTEITTDPFPSGATGLDSIMVRAQ